MLIIAEHSVINKNNSILFNCNCYSLSDVTNIQYIVFYCILYGCKIYDVSNGLYYYDYLVCFVQVLYFHYLMLTFFVFMSQVTI
jgi:hypothetical protein